MNMEPKLVNYGSSFTAWRASCLDDWRAYMHHAFVEGMKDGSLPREQFLRYLRQDYIFLIHFARAWSLAVVKAGSLAEMRAASATVHALLHFEMALHEKTCEASGISIEELEATEEAAENLAYTRYVLEAGYSGDFLDLLAALAPCVFGYGEIGVRLLPYATNNPYADWINTYGGTECQDLCTEIGALIDRACESRLGAEPQSSPRWKMLAHHFKNATKLEAQFWNLGKNG